MPVLSSHLSKFYPISSRFPTAAVPYFRNPQISANIRSLLMLHGLGVTGGAMVGVAVGTGVTVGRTDGM